MNKLFANHKSPIDFKIISFHKGFTLIELLVGMTIMAIVFLVGYANFRDFARRQELRGAVKQLQGDMRMAEQLAASGTKPAECAATTLDGYRFTINQNDNTYSIFPVCGGVEVTPVKSGIVLASVSAIVTNPSDKNSITYKVLRNGTDLTSDWRITLYRAGSEATLTTLIDTGGAISEDNSYIPPACKNIGSTCSAESPCCSGNCASGVCAAAPTATPAGGTSTPVPTSTPAPTYAPTAVPGCREVGLGCMGDLDCCSNICNGWGYCEAASEGGCVFPQTDPYFTEDQPNQCFIHYGCGSSDQFCL